ncbi:MAG: hypothetical protein IJ134_03930 [Bacilli bacterium]|nr:hypothetical protein [Bacilli bacterium]
MKESIGNTLILNIVIVFVIVFIGLFVTSITYSKGYKVKNRMIEIIEKKYPTCGSDIDDCNKSIMNQIELELNKIGYRGAYGNYSKQTCENHLKIPENVDYSVKFSDKYQVCFALINTKGRDNNPYVYYAVNAYMYLDLPVIGDRLQIPVRGESKTFIPGLTS